MHPISPWTIHQFLTSMTFTTIVETTILLLLLKKVIKHGHISKSRIFIAGIFANFATVPYVWFIFPYLFSWSLSASLLFSEPFVAVVEAVFYRIFLKTSWKASFLISITANLTSYLLGPYLRAHGLWLYW